MAFYSYDRIIVCLLLMTRLIVGSQNSINYHSYTSIITNNLQFIEYKL
jgi:hypothetical protein